MENCGMNTPKIVYTGKGDTFDFGGANSFAGERLTGEEYGFTLKNTHATLPRVVAISTAQYTSKQALLKKFSGVDALIQEGTVAEVEMSAHQDKNPINEFLTYVKDNPTRVVSLALDSDKKENFNYSIEQYQGVTPFKEATRTSINLRKFAKADQFQTDRMDIDLMANGTVLEFSNESVILIKIAPASSLTVILGIGAKDSRATNLRKRANVAKDYLVSKGVH